MHLVDIRPYTKTADAAVTGVSRNDGNPLIDGRCGRRRMRGRLDVVERERLRAGSHVGWKRNDSWVSLMVLQTFGVPKGWVYGRRLVFVSERTNKRHHHHKGLQDSD